MLPFFQSLQRKDGLGSCCGAMKDCFPVAARSPRNSPSGHWEAFIDKEHFGDTAPDTWVEIPDKMVDDKDTDLPRPPQAIACWYPFAGGGYMSPGHLLCFRTPEVQD